MHNAFGFARLNQVAATATVAVRTLLGGCACHALTQAFEAVVALLVRKEKPERLFVELSHVGEPKALREILEKSELKTAIEIVEIVCVVDIGVAIDEERKCGELAKSDIFRNQVEGSDVVLGSKIDLLARKGDEREEARRTFEEWIESTFALRKKCRVMTSFEASEERC